MKFLPLPKAINPSSKLSNSTVLSPLAANNIIAPVERFKFKDVIPGKKGFGALEAPLDWLVNAGIVLKVKTANQAHLPLEHYCKFNIFKLFIFDVGLLGAMQQIDPYKIYMQDYGIAKGYYLENYVAQALTSEKSTLFYGDSLYSWQENTAEIEFLHVDSNQNIIPIEVKAGISTKAKSLQSFVSRYNPAFALKLSSQKFNRSGTIKNLPLYLASNLYRDSFLRSLI